MDRCLSVCCYIVPINHIYIYKVKAKRTSIEEKKSKERKILMMTILYRQKIIKYNFF